jgi:hypothetical protein
MTPAVDQDPGPPTEHARAESYLRLRAEAELRRVQALPRPAPPAESGLPGPLRGAAALVLPLGRRSASVLQPIAENAARILQPLAEDAAHRVQPLAEDAARRIRPLADQAVSTVRPLAGEAARRLQPLASQAGGRLQALRYSAPYVLTQWRWRAAGATDVLRRRRASPEPGQEEPSAGEGVRQLRVVALALSRVGAIDRATADSVVDGLETALVARSRIDAHQLIKRDLLGARRRRQHSSAPGGPYLAVPIGVTVPGAPDTGLAEVRLFALVIAPDRALLTATGRLRELRGERGHQHPWPLFHGPGAASAIDDRGTAYQLYEDGGSSDDEGNWSAVLSISPVPHTGIRWLEVTMSPGSPPVRVDIASHGNGADEAASPAAAVSPAEGMVDTAAVRLLHTALADDDDSVRWHDLSDITDVVTALDAIGALAPARDAVGRLVTLARRLGRQIPPALAAAAQPAELPAAWENMLENRERKDGPCAVAAAAAVLPELDGTRFVLAGLRSGAAGAELQVLAWGWREVPHFYLFEDAANQWSWSARDDKGRWHIATEGSGSSDDRHATLELQLVPALHPEATSLEVTLACPSGQLSATVPLNWWEAG